MGRSQLALLITLGGLSSLGGGLLGPVYPLFVVDRFSASLVDVGALAAVFGLVAAVLKAPSGKLVDLYGKEKVFFAGVITAAACTLSYLFASDLTGLYLIEIFYGLAYALQSPALLSIMMDLSETGKRGLLLGAFESFYDGVAAIAALVSALIVSRLGFGALFVMCSCCQAMAGVFVLRMRRIQNPFARPQSPSSMRCRCGRQPEETLPTGSDSLVAGGSKPAQCAAQ